MNHPVHIGDQEEFKNTHGEEKRYDYDLRPWDHVLDIGGYEGEFAKKIFDKFECAVNVYEPTEKIAELDTSGTKIVVNKIAAWTHTGEITLGGEWFWTSMKEVYNNHPFPCIDVAGVIRAHRDLAVCKINIEGGEYALLNYMLDNNLHQFIKNFQVQFHKIDGENSEEQYENLARRLSETHELTWRTPFVWENWKLKKQPLFAARFRENIYSQNGEDGIIRECVARFANVHKAACEFGAHDGITFSNTYLLLKAGWTGVMIESGDDKFEALKNNMKGLRVMTYHKAVTPENVNDVVPPILDVLSIDIDGDDYAIWLAYTGKAKLVVIEVNSSFNPDVKVIGKHGASYLTMLKLGLKKNYFLLCHIGNMIFVHNDHRHLFPEITADPITEPSAYFDYSWI